MITLQPPREGLMRQKRFLGVDEKSFSVPMKYTYPASE